MLKSFAFAREAAAQIGALRMGLSLGNLKLIDVCCASNAIGDGQQACSCGS